MRLEGKVALITGGERGAACEVARGSVGKPLTVPDVVNKFRLVCGLDDPDCIVGAVMEGTCDLGTLLRLK